MEATLAGLKELGIDAAPEDSMRYLGEKYDMEPRAMFEAISQLKNP